MGSLGLDPIIALGHFHGSRCYQVSIPLIKICLIIDLVSPSTAQFLRHLVGTALAIFIAVATYNASHSVSTIKLSEPVPMTLSPILQPWLPSVPLGSTIVPGRLTQKRDPVFRLKVIGNVSGNWRGGWRRGMCHMWDALGAAHSSLSLCYAPLRVSPNFSLLSVSQGA